MKYINFLFTKKRVQLKISAKLLIFIFTLFLANNVMAQEPICNWSDSLIKTETINMLKRSCLEFNKEVEPKSFDNEEQLLDSLRKENISHIIYCTGFLAHETNMDDASSAGVKSSTMDKQIPFIRYCIEISEFRDVFVTIIQGHDYW